jgi:hypothetical protein
MFRQQQCFFHNCFFKHQINIRAGRWLLTVERQQ